MSYFAKTTGLSVFASAGLLVALFAGSNAPVVTQPEPSAQSVNLALRRTVHHLLRKSGDRTSRIPPVRQENTHTAGIYLNHPVDYSQLPALLQESFRAYHIDATYEVALLDCARGTVLLGYTSQDLLAPNGVPCAGRDQNEGCYYLKVTLNSPEPALSLPPMGWVLSIGMVLGGLVYLVRRKPVVPTPVHPSTDPTSPEPVLIHVGQLALNPATYTLRSGTEQVSLTYREAKLLRFFIDHPNQVLERERILKAVWEDEGIIVDRSLDVFVSRLRKLLRPDPTLRLVAVYGVGYRLETHCPNPS